MADTTRKISLNMDTDAVQKINMYKAKNNITKGLNKIIEHLIFEYLDDTPPEIFKGSRKNKDVFIEKQIENVVNNDVVDDDEFEDL